MKLIIFFGLMALGFILIYYSKWLTNHTLRFELFERIFGPGGTYSAWKLIGLGLIAFAFYYLIH